MPQKTNTVSLRELLRDVSASLPENRSQALIPECSPVAIPVSRTSEDRSRLRQKVLEELARRREATQVSRRETASSLGAAENLLPGLVPADPSCLRLHSHRSVPCGAGA